MGLPKTVCSCHDWPARCRLRGQPLFLATRFCRIWTCLVISAATRKRERPVHFQPAAGKKVLPPEPEAYLIWVYYYLPHSLVKRFLIHSQFYWHREILGRKVGEAEFSGFLYSEAYVPYIRLSCRIVPNVTTQAFYFKFELLNAHPRLGSGHPNCEYEVLLKYIICSLIVSPYTKFKKCK